MKRVLIIGCSGSGKSTLALKLAVRTGLPVIHLDEEYFGPDWKEPRSEDWSNTVASLAARDRWIMDGNFSGTLNQRIPLADTIIFLDRPTWLCLWRVVLRTIRYYGRVRPGSAPGCRERFDRHFLHYVANYNITRRPKVVSVLADQEERGKIIYHVRGRREIDAILNGCSVV